MILGAVLAGGRSSRFGSDKALAEFDGHTLLTIAVDSLSGWCDHVIVTGRETAPAFTVPDWPRADMGPLGGLAAALRHAADQGYETVLSCGVDAVLLPEDLPTLLGRGPSCVADQPVIGMWPVSVLPTLERLLQSAERHSLQRLAELTVARMVALPRPIPNVNTPDDLAAITASPSAHAQ